MTKLHADIERLRAARDRIVRLRGRVDASESAPEDRPRDRDWVPREILAHCGELLPFWLGEIERVLAGSPEPVPYGRTAGDPIRTMTVDRDRTLPVGELYARLDSGTERAVKRLVELDDRQCAKRGLHPTRGEMTVQEIVEAMLSGHMDEHATQLEEALGQSAPKPDSGWPAATEGARPEAPGA